MTHLIDKPGLYELRCGGVVEIVEINGKYASSDDGLYWDLDGRRYGPGRSTALDIIGSANAVQVAENAGFEGFVRIWSDGTTSQVFHNREEAERDARPVSRPDLNCKILDLSKITVDQLVKPAPKPVKYSGVVVFAQKSDQDNPDVLDVWCYDTKEMALANWKGSRRLHSIIPVETLKGEGLEDANAGGGAG